METRWLTYDELAAALHIAPDSARRLVARNKNWPRRPGNDGRVRIGVPAERLPPDGPPDARADTTPDATPDAGADITPAVRVLAQHIERLEQALATAQTARDTERARAGELEVARAELDAQVGALKQVLAQMEAQVGASQVEVARERDRVAAITTDLMAATARATEAAAHGDALKSRLEAKVAEFEAYRSRSWWRRLVS
jgi:hypothetical protein